MRTRHVLGPLALTLSVLVSSCAAEENPAAGQAEDALMGALPIGRWTRFHIRSHGHLRVKSEASAGAARRLLIADHWGFAPTRLRPAVVLDASVEDGAGQILVPTRHNTSRDDNGLEPDPIDLVTPPTGRFVIDLREVDGVEGDFELRVEERRAPLPTPPAAPAGPPLGVVVHTAGAVTTDASPPTSPAILLAGGGPDDDAAMSALVEAGGRGDAVILRMDDTGGAYARYFVARGARAATEISFDAAGGNDEVAGATLARLRTLANDRWVAQRIDAAETVFIAGGNQTKYVDVWRETEVAAALGRLVARGATVGGTSAGMHALAGVVHTPRGPGNSVISADALRDPYVGVGEVPGSLSLDLTVGSFAIPLLRGVVTDTHWTQRDRLGRSLVFLARSLTDGLGTLGGLTLLACDEGVAVLFDAAGTGRVFGGSGAAYAFRPDQRPERCVDDQPLLWSSGVPFERVAATADGRGTISLAALRGTLRARIEAGVARLP